MPQQKYRVTLSDGRQFDVVAEGGPPSEDEIMAVLAQQPEEQEEPRQKGLVQKGWEAATTPLVNIRGGPMMQEATEQFAKEHPVIGGAANFGLDVLSSLSSPLNFALPAVGGLEVGAARVGLPAIAKAAKLARIGTSAGMSVEGLQNLAQGYQAGSPEQGVAGGLELLGGVMGLRGGRLPRRKPTITPEVPIRPEVNQAIAAPSERTVVVPESKAPVVLPPEATAVIPPEPKPQPTLPFEPTTGQLELPIPSEMEVLTPPVRRGVNPAVAESIKTGKPVPAGEVIAPVLDPRITPDAIVKAQKSGQITQAQAVKLMEKYYLEEAAKGKPKLPTTKEVVEEPIKAEQPITSEQIEAAIPPTEAPKVEVPPVTPPVAEAPRTDVIPLSAVERLKKLGYDEAAIDAMSVDEAITNIKNQVKAPTAAPVVAAPKTALEIAKEARAVEVPPVKETPVGRGPGITPPPVQPLQQLPTKPGVAAVIKRIPQTGNPELDSMVKSLRAMRRRKGINEFNDLETQAYEMLMKNIRNHPALPAELREAWARAEFTQPPTTPIEVPPHAGVEKTTNIIPHERVDTDFIAKAKSEGWVFDGLTDRGDYRFRKATTAPEPVEAPPTISEPGTIAGGIDVNSIKSPNAKLWAQMVNELDAAKAPDSSYRAILSTGGKEGLKPGQTWRQKVLSYIDYVVKNEKGELIISKKEKPNILRSTPEGGVILVKSGKAGPDVIKRLVNEGFKFVGENEIGDMRFQKGGPTGTAPVLESEVGLTRPTRKAANPVVEEANKLGPNQDEMKSSVIAEAFNLPRGLLASWDFSAPLRQGLPLIHKKEFWNALRPMWESWKTEGGFRASQKAIADRALFKKRNDAFGREIGSFADDAGLKLTDLKKLTTREEAIMSTWAESGGMFERNLWMAKHGGREAAEAYRATVGNLVRRSNRAYVAFLNNLRADVFESLVRDSGVLADIKNNVPLTRALADFVNTATGRGSLGKLESSAVALNTGLFAPRLIASRVKMLNPYYYIMAPPQVRTEALKSLFAIAGVGNSVLLLAKMAGAEVGTDPNSSDFGKAKIGDARLDPWGGFQQYIVAANRLLRPSFAKVPGMEGIDTGIAPLDVAAGFLGTGGQTTTSSTSNQKYDLWNARGPYDPTHASIAGRFIRGKVNPTIGFAWSLFAGSKEMSGKPMNFKTLNPMDNAVMQRFIPILMQDIYQLANESPELLPLAVPAAFGMGVQQYGTLSKY